MKTLADHVVSEAPLLAKIICDECWLEGERRGHPVKPNDPVVQQRVAEIIIKSAGAWMADKVAEREEAA